MCWSFRVFLTVAQNLFIRIINDISNLYYNGCCTKSNNHHNDLNEINQLDTEDYVVVNIPEEYVIRSPIPRRKTIESEPYYRAVDRITAEDILINRVDGSCLVRPYKENDTSIKYIVSVYAKNNFFHLYVRKIHDLEKYGIGLEKPYEKLFNTPNDIINYYKLNKLLCTNKFISISLVLIPIS